MMVRKAGREKKIRRVALAQNLIIKDAREARYRDFQATYLDTSLCSSGEIKKELKS